MKEEREKARSKNKEPKEEFVDLGKPKNKTAKNSQNENRKPPGSSESSFEDAFNEEGRSSPKENSPEIRQSERVVHHEEPADAKSKR